MPSHPGVGQFTPSNFIAGAATTALCCSTLPPDSRTLIFCLLAIGQPDALQQRFNDLDYCTPLCNNSNFLKTLRFQNCILIFKRVE